MHMMRSYIKLHYVIYINKVDYDDSFRPIKDTAVRLDSVTLDRYKNNMDA